MVIENNRFDDLMQAGRSAYALGNYDQAHDFWKEAARLNPYQEVVWLSLLDVVEIEADRQVCLENIVKINPGNAQAQRLLNRMRARHDRIEEYVSEKRAVARETHNWRRSLFARALMLGLVIGLSGVIFGVVISIVIYGR